MTIREVLSFLGLPLTLLHDLQLFIDPCGEGPASVGCHEGIKAVTSFVALLWWCRIKSFLLLA